MSLDKHNFTIGLLELTRYYNRDATDHLAECFVELATRVEILCRQLEHTAKGNDAASIAQHMQTEEIRNLIRENILFMQAHDATDQRLGHLHAFLTRSELPMEVLSEERERHLADLMTQGVPLADAVAQAMGHEQQNSVELF